MKNKLTKESVFLRLPKFPKEVQFGSFSFKPGSALPPSSFDKGMFFKHTTSTSIENHVRESLLNIVPNKTITENNMPYATKDLSEDYITNIINSGKSMPEITVSPDIPEGFSKQKFLEGAVIATMLHCRQQGMDPEKVAIFGAFAFGNPGSNMTSIEMVGHLPIFKAKLNMTPYLQKDHEYSIQNLEKVQKLPIKKFMSFSETETLDWVNKCLDLKFILYQRKATLAENHTIQNLSGNRSPDFVRHLTPPVGLITTEAYDQKFSIANMSNHNHIRPVSANLGTQTDKALTCLVNGIIEWRTLNQKNATDNRGYLLQEKLEELRKNYIENHNAQLYARNYNSLRNTFGDFLISKEIRMNLVAETGIQNYNFPPEDTKMFNTCFTNMYYNPNSAWHQFVQESMRNSNGTLKHPDLVITAFAAQYVTVPLV